MASPTAWHLRHQNVPGALAGGAAILMRPDMETVIAATDRARAMPLAAFGAADLPDFAGIHFAANQVEDQLAHAGYSQIPTSFPKVPACNLLISLFFFIIWEDGRIIYNTCAREFSPFTCVKSRGKILPTSQNT